MSLADLNQRYANTFIWYDGKARNCREFIPSNVDGVMFGENIKEGVKWHKFDWQKLEITRPKARWLIYNEHPLYFFYNNARQWSRGFSRTTVSTFHAMPRDKPFHLARELDEVLTVAFTQVPMKRQTFTLPDLLQKVGEKGWVLLSDQMLACHSVAYGGPCVFLRTECIANLGTEVKMVDPYFKAEVEEVIRHV